MTIGVKERTVGLWCLFWLAIRMLASASSPSSLYLDDDTLSVQRPDHVNNAESRYFPPVFNQDGGSCGSASRIGYMFTHEINAFRGKDASLPENIYPTHFTWLLTNSHSGKEGMAMANGVPDAVVYGGTTYSKVFGNQDCSHEDFGWMQGYDKWYSAMFNRISHNSNSPYSVDTEAGREYVKRWLWNHCGDTDFHVGGICGIGVASACKQAPIGEDPEGRNAAAGVVGQKYVTRWGDGVDHALTIVGYDDRIVFDLDSNNVYGEKDKDECGAWIIVNSWGSGWANHGFIYCPYKYGFPVRMQEGGAWKPEFYHVRKNYRPLRTLKLRMDYRRRSELKLLAGISADLYADEPEVTVEMEHFKYAGDGRSDKAKMGVEALTPMLGKWADGTLHEEPMEFGYDLTDLSSSFDTRRPLKYFFIVETKPESVSFGHLYECSVIDYEFDSLGVETPLMLEPYRMIRSGGTRTVVAAVVLGEPFFAPRNLHRAGESELRWNAPQPTHYTLDSYVVYKDGQPSDTLPASDRSYRCEGAGSTYGVAALYKYPSGGHGTSLATSAVAKESYRGAKGNAEYRALDLHGSGFCVPDVFDTRHDKATIEYWLKPHTWVSWNQAAGAGWGNFLIHGNDNGALTVGWDGDNRIDTKAGTVLPGRWYHFAFVVSKDTLTAFVNGEPVDTLISTSRKGVGGFGKFDFATSRNGAFDGELAELRIWKVARTQQQIAGMMNSRFEDAGIPPALLAYYKGQIITKDSTDYWRDFAGGHHAPLHAYGSYTEKKCERQFAAPRGASVDFLYPISVPRAGHPIELQAITSPSISKIRWDATEAGVNGLELRSVSLLFPAPGRYTVSLQGETADGHTVSSRKDIVVRPVCSDATIRPIRRDVRIGERVTFSPMMPVPGRRYEWTLNGADRKKIVAQNAAVTYTEPGNYKVRLRTTDINGKKRSGSFRLRVGNVAPEVHFDISSRVVRKGTKVTLTDRSRYAPTKWEWRIESRQRSLTAEGRNASVVPEHPGMYDVTLTAANAEGSGRQTQKRMLAVCNADSKNGLNFSREEASVTTVSPLLEDSTEQLTVEWWMNASASDRTSGMGHSAGTLLLRANRQGTMTLFVDSAKVNSGKDFILTGSWHHYAVTFDKGEVRFVRDGEVFHTATLKRKNQTVTRIPSLKWFRLGGKDNPMNAVADELRVWKTALPDSELHAVCNAPIADVAEREKDGMLLLYYTFNQNGGDVNDETSNGNSGVRDGFGPDGDAWGLSSGVFSLGFE